MKLINLADITTTVGMPFKSGSFSHLQDAYKETIAAMVRNIIGVGYDATAYYILHGCVNSGSGSNFVISAGAIFYNGEIYEVPAATFTASGGQTAVGTITTTYFSGASSDPVEFTDGVSRNVHEIRTINFSSGVSGSGNVDFANLLTHLSTGYIPVLNASFFEYSTQQPLRINKIGNLVVFSGAIRVNTTGSGENICTLPTLFRPSATVQSYAVLFAGGTITLVNIQITTAGVVSLQNAFSITNLVEFNLMYCL